MNCKQGDLAVIIKSDAGNEGKIVTCLNLVRGKVFRGVSGDLVTEDAWEVDLELRAAIGAGHNFIADRKLRPIRDQPGADETLTWCDVPSKVTA